MPFQNSSSTTETFAATCSAQHHLSTLGVPAWWASPSSSTESHYKVFFLTQLSHWHLWPHLLKYISKLVIPIYTLLVHMWWVQQSSWQSSLLLTQSILFFLNQFWKCNSICQENCPLPRANHKNISNWHHYLLIQKEQGSTKWPTNQHLSKDIRSCATNPLRDTATHHTGTRTLRAHEAKPWSTDEQDQSPPLQLSCWSVTWSPALGISIHVLQF